MNAAARVPFVGAVASLLAVLPLFAITQERGWIVPAAVAIALVAATGHWLRRIHVPPVLVPIAQLAVLVLWLGVVVAGDVALFGFIPTAEWATRLVDVARGGVESISAYASPAPVTTGILLLLVGGSGLVALLVDQLASGLRRAVLAGVPLAACYAVAAGVAQGALAWWWFVPPGIGYLSLLMSDGRTRIASWGRSASPSPRHSGVPETDSLVRNGRRVGAVALIAAVAIPAFVPALTEGILGPGGAGGGSGGRTIRTDNPIVDLQRNLTRPDNVDVLSYTSSSNDPQYIRTVTLDVFNGEVWQTSDRDVPRSQRVADGMPPPPGLQLRDVPLVDYSVEVTDNYSSRWLPLPYPAQQIEIEGDWRYDINTLDVISPDDDAQGTAYTATSYDVTPTPEALAAVRPYRPELAALTALPDDLPELVTDLAAEVTADADDAFGRALALQAFFRNTVGEDGFTYDLTAEPGTSATALVDFLTERRGYCEQFAASMAIMARTLDIPARVAVGFTPGDFQGDATWLIRAHDAHAWPELYFEGIGWVLFEPTPATRTGPPPQWTVVNDGNEPTTPGPAPSTPTPSSSATGAVPRDDTAGGGGSASDSGSTIWPVVILGVVALAAVVYAPTGVARLRRARRWQRAGDDPVRNAEAAWTDLREAALDAALPWDSAATPRMIGAQVAHEAELDADERDLLGHVVTTTERARYARTAPEVPSLRADVAMLRRAILASRTRGRRVAAFLWPSAVQELFATLGTRLADGFDWLDGLGERVRASVLRLARAGTRR